MSLVAAALLLAASPQHYRVLPGPMPQLSAPAVPGAPAPAPVPDRDAAPPPATAPGTRLAPALIDRGGVRAGGSGYTPGSAYSPGLERRGGPSGSELGTTLAPGFRLLVPLE